MKVTLIDGPYEGAEVERGQSSGTLLMEGDFPDGTGKSEDGAMARYRPTRDRTKMRFKGWDKNIIRLPLPGNCPECGQPSKSGRCMECRGRSMIDPGADE